VELLEDGGMHFFVAFSAPEFSARLAAVAAGLGVLTMQARNVIPGIEIIRSGLPELPPNKAGIYARDGLDLDRHVPLLRTLTDVLVPHPLSESASAHPAGAALASKELAPPPRGRTHELHRAR
jgi:hypothetical protein